MVTHHILGCLLLHLLIIFKLKEFFNNHVVVVLLVDPLHVVIGFVLVLQQLVEIAARLLFYNLFEVVVVGMVGLHEEGRLILWDMDRLIASVTHINSN